MSDNLNNNLLEPFKDLFEQNKFDEALEVLQSLKADIDPGLYEFNVGSVFFAKKDYFHARKNFELAKERGFYSSETENALNKTKEILEVNYLEEPSSPQEFLEQTLVTSSLDVFVIVSLSLLLLSLVSKFHKIIRIALVLFAFFPVSFCHFEVSKYTRVIATEGISILRGPSKMFEETQIIPKGMVFIVKSKVDDWIEVAYPKSHSGWIKNKSMESL
jgi:hypothetical protein